MAPNLKVLNVLTYSAVVFGCLLAAQRLAVLYMMWTGAREGDPIGIDEVASSMNNALKGVAIGVAIVVFAFVFRALIARRLRRAQ